MADYYRAETENGDAIDDPSEDALYLLIEELRQPGNTYVTVEPAGDGDWYATVALDGDGYEIVFRDPARNQHEATTATDVGAIAHDLIVWVAARR